MQYIIQNDELKHFGVLGMKWGIRRYQPYSVNPRKSGKTGVEKGEAAKKKRESHLLRDEKKLSKITRKQENKDLKSQRYYSKAEWESIRYFGSKKSEAKYIEKSAKYRKQANFYAQKGMVAYEKILSKYPDLKLSDQSHEMGNQFIQRVKENNYSFYNSYMTNMLNEHLYKKK